MFPENGSGVEAARDYGAWELEECATKKSGHAERGCVYKLTYTSVTSAHTRATVL